MDVEITLLFRSARDTCQLPIAMWWLYVVHKRAHIDSAAVVDGVLLRSPQM